MSDEDLTIYNFHNFYDLQSLSKWLSTDLECINKIYNKIDNTDWNEIIKNKKFNTIELSDVNWKSVSECLYRLNFY